MPEMVHKNLRTLLYYICGVTLVCLCIELSKRGGGLSPSLYVVETASNAELKTTPHPPPINAPDNNKKDRETEELIPRRNRGQPGTREQEKPNTLSEKEQFKLWKASMKISPEEVGLFKKWKQEQGLRRKGKKQSDIEEQLEEAEEEEEEEEEEEIEEEEKSNKKIKNKTKSVEELSDNPEEESEDEDEEEEDEEEYPTGVTEYDPPDSQHSCTDLTLTDKLLERANQVSAACERLQDEIGDQRRLYSRLRWAVPERLLYCPIFKAASTSWLMNFFKLSNSTRNPKSGNLHTKITNMFPPPATFKLRKKIFDESTKMIIVRHPFERVVSAYRDKLAGFSRNPHYLEMRKHIIDEYRKNKKSKTYIPTFRESFDFILAELDKMENSQGKGKVLIDGHFMPYSRRCLPCVMKYDVIIKMETLEEDSKYLIEQCGLENRLDILHENPAPTGPETDQGYKNKSKKVKKGQKKPQMVNSDTRTAQDYFRDIPVSKIKQLYQHYRQDFEIFGYSAEEYLAQD